MPTAGRVKEVVAATPGRVSEQTAGWVREQLAYVFGMYAYAYGFPLVLIDLTRQAPHRDLQPSATFFRAGASKGWCPHPIPEGFTMDRGPIVRDERPLAGGPSAAQRRKVPSAVIAKEAGCEDP